MNQYKFRAWHKELKVMYKVIQLEWLGDEFESLFKVCTWREGDSIFGRNYNPNEIELMQYTGYQDNEGIDIYDKDICILDDREQDKYWIEHFEGCWTLKYKSKYFDMPSILILDGLVDRLKVIGNKFEHSELLNNE